MTAGSVTTLFGHGVNWTISELAANHGHGEIIPVGRTCTRLETSIEDFWKISYWASVRHPFAYCAASLPFARLFDIYRCAAMTTLAACRT